MASEKSKDETGEAKAEESKAEESKAEESKAEESKAEAGEEKRASAPPEKAEAKAADEEAEEKAAEDEESAEEARVKARKAAKAKAKEAEKAKPVAAKEKHDEGHAAHGHGHKIDRREYIVMFFVLLVLTLLEVGIVQIPGISKLLVRIGLVGLAVTKAACVGLYYMHLKHETKVMKLTVFLPFIAPAVYAMVLIGEAAWRLTR